MSTRKSCRCLWIFARPSKATSKNWSCLGMNSKRCWNKLSWRKKNVWPRSRNSSSSWQTASRDMTNFWSGLMNKGTRCLVWGPLYSWKPKNSRPWKSTYVKQSPNWNSRYPNCSRPINYWRPITGPCWIRLSNNRSFWRTPASKSTNSSMKRRNWSPRGRCCKEIILRKDRFWTRWTAPPWCSTIQWWHRHQWVSAIHSRRFVRSDMCIYWPINYQIKFFRVFVKFNCVYFKLYFKSSHVNFGEEEIWPPKFHSGSVQKERGVPVIDDA